MGSMMGGVGSAVGVWGLVGIGLVIAVLVIAGVALLGRTRRDGPKGDNQEIEDTPGAILRRRYAAGEIDEDEYLRRLAGLSQR